MSAPASSTPSATTRTHSRERERRRSHSRSASPRTSTRKRKRRTAHSNSSASSKSRSRSRSRSRSNSKESASSSSSRSRSRSHSPASSSPRVVRTSGRIGGYVPGGVAIQDDDATTMTPQDPTRAADNDKPTAARPSADGKATRGGVYVPPHKLRAAQAEVLAHSTAKDEAVQKIHWEALRKTLNGLINKANTSNIKHLLPELFSENIIRGRGLLVKSIMKAQMTAPTFTPIYAALLSVLNTKMPEIGELLCKRLVMTFRRAFKRADKLVCLAVGKFIAHLTNQAVLHELVALQLLTLLLEKPTDDSVELAIDFIKECGACLNRLTPLGMRGIFDTLRTILNEGNIGLRVSVLIEGLFAVRQTNFKQYPAIPPELDLVELEDQVTHELSLEEEYDMEVALNVFKYDQAYEENEEAYKEIKREILGDDDEQADGDGGGGDAAGAGAGGGGGEEEQKGDQQNMMEDVHADTAVGSGDAGMEITDMSEQDVVNLRRSIYLTIMSSLNFEEAVHKLMKLKIPKGSEHELVNMVIEICTVDRTFNKMYSGISQRLCLLRREYADAFSDAFAKNYALIHRLETNRLRNMAKLFAHLLHTDALDWSCLQYIRLTEEDTTSAGRIFIKILFRELSELYGLTRLRKRVAETQMEQDLAGLFPRDQPKNTRFAINFFTSIGLGGLTEGLREHLKNAPKVIMAQTNTEEMSSSSSESESDSDSDSSSNSDSSSSSGSGSSSSSSSSNSDSSSSSSGSDSDSSSSASSSSSSSSDDSAARRKRRKAKSKHRSTTDDKDAVKLENTTNTSTSAAAPTPIATPVEPTVKLEPGVEGTKSTARRSKSPPSSSARASDPRASGARRRSRSRTRSRDRDHRRSRRAVSSSKSRSRSQRRVRAEKLAGVSNASTTGAAAAPVAAAMTTSAAAIAVSTTASTSSASRHPRDSRDRRRRSSRSRSHSHSRSRSSSRHLARASRRSRSSRSKERKEGEPNPRERTDARKERSRSRSHNKRRRDSRSASPKRRKRD